VSVSSFLSMCYMVRRGITLRTIARSARFVLLTIGFTLSLSVWGIESSVNVKLLVDVLYGKTRHHSLAYRSCCLFRIAHNRITLVISLGDRVGCWSQGFKGQVGCRCQGFKGQVGCRCQGSSRVSVPRNQGSSQMSGQGQGFASLVSRDIALSIVARSFVSYSISHTRLTSVSV
jgi:hypothetical protein